MSRSKLKRFAENELRDNVIQPGKPLYESIKGKWRELYFENDHPIVVEMACGRGEYSVGLARQFPDKNFIGVDIKGDRLWKGSGIAEKEGLQNVAFLRTQIQQADNFFAPNEVDEIWITFPDPRPKDRDEKRRLTYPRFLDLYKDILKPGGTVHLKTDNDFLFEYTLELLKKEYPVQKMAYTHDLYDSPWQEIHFGIKTRFEKKFSALGYSIKYLQFQFV